MWLNAVIVVLSVALFLVCGLMILVILMQRSKQEGIGAAFGGGMTDSVFGADTTNVLSKTTVWCTVLFFAITLALSGISAHRFRNSAVRLQQAAEEAAKAMAPATPGGTNTAPAAVPGGTNTAPIPAAGGTNAAPASARP
jgi:preprotein translocase subunit SecG